MGNACIKHVNHMDQRESFSSFQRPINMSEQKTAPIISLEGITLANSFVTRITINQETMTSTGQLPLTSNY